MCKTCNVFQCQICTFMTFLSPSSWLLLKLPIFVPQQANLKPSSPYTPFSEFPDIELLRARSPRPFSIALTQSLFQSEPECEILVLVISSTFNMNENWYSKQRLCTQTRFEIKAEVNSKMVYSHRKCVRLIIQESAASIWIERIYDWKELKCPRKLILPCSRTNNSRNPK